MRSPYIYSFKIYINNAVIYYHIGSTCDPAGTLILVLLDPNTRSFYDKYFILNLYGSPYLKKRVLKKKVYEKDTSISTSIFTLKHDPVILST